MLSVCLFLSLSLCVYIFSHTYAHAHTRTPLLSLHIPVILMLVCCSTHVCVLSQAVHCAASPDGMDTGCCGSRRAPSQFLGGQRWRTAGSEALTAGSWLRTSTVKVSPHKKISCFVRNVSLVTASRQAEGSVSALRGAWMLRLVAVRVALSAPGIYLLASVDKLVAW